MPAYGNFKFITDSAFIEHLYKSSTFSVYKDFIDGNEAFKIFSMDLKSIQMWSLTNRDLYFKPLPEFKLIDEGKGFSEIFKENILKSSEPPPRIITFESKGSYLDDVKKPSS